MNAIVRWWTDLMRAKVASRPWWLSDQEENDLARVLGHGTSARFGAAGERGR